MYSDLVPDNPELVDFIAETAENTQKQMQEKH
jgi:hypothetical protein